MALMKGLGPRNRKGVDQETTPRMPRQDNVVMQPLKEEREVLQLNLRSGRNRYDTA